MRDRDGVAERRGRRHRVDHRRWRPVRKCSAANSTTSGQCQQRRKSGSSAAACAAAPAAVAASASVSVAAGSSTRARPRRARSPATGAGPRARRGPAPAGVRAAPALPARPGPGWASAAPQRGLVGGLARRRAPPRRGQVQAGDQAQQQGGARSGCQPDSADPGAADAISAGWRSRLAQNWIGQARPAAGMAPRPGSRAGRGRAPARPRASSPHWLRTKTQARGSMPCRKATRVERAGRLGGIGAVGSHSPILVTLAVEHDLTDAELPLRQTVTRVCAWNVVHSAAQDPEKQPECAGNRPFCTPLLAAQVIDLFGYDRLVKKSPRRKKRCFNRGMRINAATLVHRVIHRSCG